MSAVAFDTLTWLNEPMTANVEGGRMTVKTARATDFWQETFYGFRRDSGHFLHKTVTGNFTASVKVTGRFETLYDQVGLMLRSDATHWVKAGVELTDGALYLSTVVTNGFSDWSITPCVPGTEEVHIRLTRHDESIRVQTQDPRDGSWVMTRLGYLQPTKTLQIGLMCCSPEREGFEATFRDFTLGSPIDRTLHMP